MGSVAIVLPAEDPAVDPAHAVRRMNCLARGKPRREAVRLVPLDATHQPPPSGLMNYLPRYAPIYP